MSSPYDDLAATLVAQLTPAERATGVAYVSTTAIASGTSLNAAAGAVSVPWNAYLGFVDRDPLANWGHSSRYVLINRATGETQSIETRFPSFSRREPGQWRIVHRAPEVPDAALLVSE